jgi:hypothetical protein
MQLYLYENFFIISELFILAFFLYVFCLQLIPLGGIKVKVNAYTFTYSLGLLTLISIIIQFILVNTKLNLTWSIFNFAIQLTTITSWFFYLLIFSVIICLIFIIKINCVSFQQILLFYLMIY